MEIPVVTFSHRCILLSILLFALFVAGCGPLKLPPFGQGTAPQTSDQRPEQDPLMGGPPPPIRPGMPEVPPTATPKPAPLSQTVVEQTRVPLSHYLSPADQIMPPVPAAWAETENFLILGTDKRAGDVSWRTDVIMVAGLDRELGRAVLFSIPRDLYVNIPGTRPNRINTVDYMGERILWVEGGGPALLSHVIQQNLGIPTQQWIRLEMNGVTELVDAIGGVTVNLDCPLYEPILNLTTNEWEYFTLPAGEVFLDGEDAAWFVRLRLRESDIGRANRQRQLLWALRNQALSANLLVRLPDLWGAFNNMFETDIGLLKMVSLAQIALSLEPSEIRSGGLMLKDLESFMTEEGAQVLRISDPARVMAVVEAAWNAPSVAKVAPAIEEAAPSALCPPAPVGPPGNPYSTPDPTQSPESEETEGVQAP